MRCDAHSSRIMPPNNATSQILRCTLSSSARLRKSEVGRSLTTTVLRFMQATPRERKLAVVANQAPSPPPPPPQSHSSMHVFLMCIGFTVGSQWPQLNASATPIKILGTWLINIKLLSRPQSRIMQCRAAMYNFPLVVTTLPPPRCFLFMTKQNMYLENFAAGNQLVIIAHSSSQPSLDFAILHGICPSGNPSAVYTRRVASRKPLNKRTTSS